MSDELTLPVLDRARELVSDGDPIAAVRLLLPAVKALDGELANVLRLQNARARDATAKEMQGLLPSAQARAVVLQVSATILGIVDELVPRAVPGPSRASPPGPLPPPVPPAVSPAAPSTPPVRDQVFVSYSHRDKEWLERLRRMLAPLVRNGGLDLWDDSRIAKGSRWREEIETALARAAVAVLLVTDNFLASDFIQGDELPTILDAESSGALTVLWVYVSDSLYEETAIARFQAAHDPSVALAAMSPADQSAALKSIALAVKAAVERTAP